MSQWGIENPKPVHSDTCPKCGADVAGAVADPEDDKIYRCGTTYSGGYCDSQSERCMSTSFTVRRRASTVTGILDGCDPIELTAVMEIVNRFVKNREAVDGEN